jgi:asparagine synthase (glutamine-hydrolysing)
MRAAVREAVEASIPASGDIAATLSGGLDSSMIVATASRLLAGQRRTVHAFTHVPLPGTQSPGPGWDVEDGPYAEAVIGSLSGVRWEQVSNDDRVPPLVDDLRSIEQAWQPSVNPTNVTWVAEMLRRAESVGSPLLLTGAAGNATFSRSSEGVVRGLLRHGRVDALVRQIRSRHRVGLDWSRAARSVLVETLPDAVLRWRRARAWRRAGDPLGTAVYGSFPARFDALSEPARARLEDLVAGVGTPRRADWISFATADYARIGLGPNMSDTVWWSDPLSDPELVSLALRLPEEAWLAGGRDRGLAREAVAGLVPDRVRLRRTSGAQSADCGLWMVGQEPAYRALLERFRASPSVGEFLDLEALERSIGPEMTDPATASDWQDVYGRAFSLGHFAVWYEDEVLGRA